METDSRLAKTKLNAAGHVLDRPIMKLMMLVLALLELGALDTSVDINEVGKKLVHKESKTL